MKRPIPKTSDSFGFQMEASAGAPLRSFNDLAAVEADLDEIESRHGNAPPAQQPDLTTMVAVAPDPTEVFANYNKGRGTPVRYVRK